MDDKLIYLQHSLKKLLEYFDNICIENNIDYSISDGTLLGGIRHKGFIPWDDDIDVLMLREEFEKLEKNTSSNFEIIDVLWTPRFLIKNKDINPNNLFIDIMVFDNAPDSKLKNSVKSFCIKILQGTLKKNIVWSNYNFKDKLLLLPTFILGKFFNNEFKMKVYEKVAQLDNLKKTSYYCSYKSTYKTASIRFNKNVFSGYIKIPFEDITVYSITGYHDYLSSYYGNYMKLPPEDERIPIHSNINKVDFD